MTDDLVKRLRCDHPDQLTCEAADRIEELEARLRGLEKNLMVYAPTLVDGPEHDVGYYYGYHTAINRIRAALAELKGGKDA